MFDARTGTLTRDNVPVKLSGRQPHLLALFLSRAGALVSHAELVAAAWGNVATSPNSLEQAISQLRKVIACSPGIPSIVNVHGHGYRFVLEVTRILRREAQYTLDELLAPHRAFLEGRAALDTLEQGAIARARSVFEQQTSLVPDEAWAHVGLANACALQFETTRAQLPPDTASLALAFEHAQQACQLNPRYGEAWATLGFVLERVGRRDDGVAALRRAVSLESDNWRHHLRLSAASWGEERLREARRTLALMSGQPMAHWLAASVLVARQAHDEAAQDLRMALEASDGEAGASAFSGIAVHWLLGLLTLAAGDTAGALGHFECELAHEGSGHLYARECAANSWYAIGAARFHEGDRPGARAAFREALTRVSAHPLARAALGESPLTPLSPVDAAIAAAVGRAARGDDDAAALEAFALEQALADAAPGNAGWLLSVEPMLRVWSRSDVWAGARMRSRRRAA